MPAFTTAGAGEVAEPAECWFRLGAGLASNEAWLQSSPGYKRLNSNEYEALGSVFSKREISF